MPFSVIGPNCGISQYCTSGQDSTISPHEYSRNLWYYSVYDNFSKVKRTLQGVRI